MPDSESSPELISEEDLVGLTKLFRDFEGCGEPFSRTYKEAKLAFQNRVSEIYFDRIEPNPDFKEWTSSQFHSVIRNICRERLFNSGPQFPSIPN
jgi:hypothetical protein